jgi:hypothetical protein
MISFIGFGYLNTCAFSHSKIKQRHENTKNIYEITDNVKNMSSLWPISWQLSNSFDKIKIFRDLFLMCIVMLVFSPQFWIFVKGLTSGSIYK